MFERAGHKDYADNVREILEAEDFSSVEVDTTTTDSTKPLPEQKPEFPSVESVSLSPSAATTTTVVVEKEHQQGMMSNVIEVHNVNFIG